MVLKKSCHKAQASLSLLQFVMLDLEYIKANFDWRILVIGIQQQDPNFNGYTSRNEKDYLQKFDEIKIAVVSHHIEIMRESLREHIKCPTGHIVDKLGLFLADLRHAFSHTKNELVPKFGKNVKTQQSFLFHIPVKKISASTYTFDAKSLESYTFECRAIPESIIGLNDRFIFNLIVLSNHVVEILKKQKFSTLEKYLQGIKNNPKGEIYPEILSTRP